MNLNINNTLDDNSYTDTDNKEKQNNKNSIVEISNIYPNNLKRSDLHASQRPYIATIRSEAYSVCRSSLPYEYIRASFNKFNRGFVYHMNNVLTAFCIWKVTDTLLFDMTYYKELYIFLLCGSQLNYKLVPRILDDVIHYCRKSNIQCIKLQSANSKLKSYYIQCGFEEKTNSANITFLVLDVNKPRMHSSSKIRITTRKQRRTNITNKI